MFQQMGFGLAVAVLVDGGSASASEILAGALQDAGRAELVGSPTFGKGTVQEWSQLPADAGGLRLSVAAGPIKNKHWVDGRGLQPDLLVTKIGQRYCPPIDGAEADAAEVEADPQLSAAVERLLGPLTPGAVAQVAEIAEVAEVDATLVPEG